VAAANGQPDHACLSLSPELSVAVPRNQLPRATIALLKSDRPDAPRAGDAYGDISITPVVASWREPRDCFGVGRVVGRAIAMPRRGQSRMVTAYTRSDRPTGADGRRERVMHSRVVLYSSRPALACIIGARRA